jgi:histone-lysine N-methyltransferase SETMAR
MIQSKKLMLTIIWNPQKSHLINVLPKGCKFNAGYYIIELLSPLSDWRRTQQRRTDRKLLIDADNAYPHIVQASRDFLEVYGMKQVPHPPYSSNLTPTDFYVFGHVKNCLAGASFADVDELLEAVMTILGEIEKVTLEAVFLEWMDRLK